VRAAKSFCIFLGFDVFSQDTTERTEGVLLQFLPICSATEYSSLRSVVFVALPPADKLVDKAMLQWTSPLPKIDTTRTQDESSVCSNHRHHFPSSLRYSITARAVRARGTRRRRRICSRATRFGFSRPRVPAVLAAGPGAETGTPEDDARECWSYVFFLSFWLFSLCFGLPFTRSWAC
jgi:hypothetical protein